MEKIKLVILSNKKAFIGVSIASLVMIASFAFVGAKVLDQVSSTTNADTSTNATAKTGQGSSNTGGDNQEEAKKTDQAKPSATAPAASTPGVKPAPGSTSTPSPTTPAPTTPAPPVAVACSGAQHTPGGPDGFGGCWPYAGNTGVPSGTVLSAYTGPCNITAANTVIKAKTINCGLNIRATNVQITNSQVNGPIIVDSNDCGTNYSYAVTDSTIHVSDINYRGLLYCNYVATRVEVTGGQSMAWCESCTIQDSFLHSPLEDPAGAAANQAAHNSTVRVARNAVIKHNTLWCQVREYQQPDGQDSSGCSANQTAYSHDGSPPSNSIMERNLYMPTTGGFCAYGGSTTGALSSVNNIVFKDNIFKRGTTPNDRGQFTCGYYGAITSFDESRPGNQWINNKFDDGNIILP